MPRPESPSPRGTTVLFAVSTNGEEDPPGAGPFLIHLCPSAVHCIFQEQLGCSYMLRDETEAPTLAYTLQPHRPVFKSQLSHLASHVSVGS